MAERCSTTLGAAGRPCRACPWRVDSHPRDIPSFDHDKAEGLVGTCPDEQGFGPEYGTPMFACHESPDGKEKACAGWLATVGAHHPGVRAAVLFGHLDESRLAPGEDWPALHPSFAEVIGALRDKRED